MDKEKQMERLNSGWGVHNNIFQFMDDQAGINNGEDFEKVYHENYFPVL